MQGLYRKNMSCTWPFNSAPKSYSLVCFSTSLALLLGCLPISIKHAYIKLCPGLSSLSCIVPNCLYSISTLHVNKRKLNISIASVIVTWVFHYLQSKAILNNAWWQHYLGNSIFCLTQGTTSILQNLGLESSFWVRSTAMAHLPQYNTHSLYSFLPYYHMTNMNTLTIAFIVLCENFSHLSDFPKRL